LKYTTLGSVRNIWWQWWDLAPFVGGMVRIQPGSYLAECVPTLNVYEVGTKEGGMAGRREGGGMAGRKEGGRVGRRREGGRDGR